MAHPNNNLVLAERQSNVMPTKSLNETTFNIDTEFQRLLGPNPFILVLPKTIGGITDALLQLRKSTVQLIAARLKRVPQGPVEGQLWKQLAAFLSAMYNLEMIDPKMKTQAQLDKGLQVIFNPIYKFPAEYARVAQYIYEKLEAECWGADEVEAEDAEEEDVLVPSSSNSTASTSVNTERKKSGPLRDSDFPADGDPIYGLNGIMHHILRIQGPKMVSYQINPAFKSKNAKAFGHNGLTVGDCWPNQMALLRDGGHGQRMGGISGSAVTGTYSIVVSGVYDDLDKDEGHQIFYSGSNSHENTSAEPVTSNKTKALERSIATRKPVRVFRSARGKWKYCPRAGLRYDGLYTIVSITIEKNGNGGSYKRFKLERLEEQDEVQINSPSQNIINLFEQVKIGYTRTRPRLVPSQ